MYSTLSSPKQVPGKIADTPDVAQHQVGTAQNVRADKAVIKKNHVKKCLDMFAEIAGKKDDQKKFSEEFGTVRKREINTSKFGKEQGNEVLHVVVDMPGAAEHRHEVMQRQVPNIQSTQKTVEVPRVQFIDRVVDDPAVMQRETFNVEARELIEDDSVGGKQQGPERPLSKKKRRLPVETESNHERFKDLILPSSQSCLFVSIASSDEGGDEAGRGSTEGWTEVKKRGKKKPTKKSMASSDEEEEEFKQQTEARSLVQGGEHRREKDETDTQGPGSELVQVAPNMGAGGSDSQATMDQEWAKELREIRRTVEFLVQRERKLDVKTDVAARRLERLEKESSQLEGEEREASLEEALADHTKVVKLTVDKWFVDKGFGFGKALSGEVVFIHASAVQGAEVLVVGTDAWTQVVSDHARAEGGGIEPERRGARERGRRKRTERGRAERRSK